MVPTVPMTPTRPVRVACAERPHARVDHSDDRHVERSRSESSAAAAAVLQATTTSFTPRRSTSSAVIWWANSATSSSGRGPYGYRAGVAQVDQVLARQQVDERPGDGQATEPGVEHPDGTVTHARADATSGDALRSR